MREYLARALEKVGYSVTAVDCGTGWASAALGCEIIGPVATLLDGPMLQPAAKRVRATGAKRKNLCMRYSRVAKALILAH